MEYWHSLIVEKSWRVLQKLKKDVSFILIGGWAAYLYAKTHKSKDIDIVVDYEALEKIKLGYDLKKNEHLKKFEISIEGIDIDIYLPYFSRLAIPVEELHKYTTSIEGFKVVKPEALLILKQGAEKERGFSEKGIKDRIDIMDLILYYGIDCKFYWQLLKRYNLESFLGGLIKIIANFKEVKYLHLNPREFKLKKEALVKELKSLR